MKPMHLYIGGRRVCVLRAGPDSDFPWFAGTLERSEHFADVEHLLLPISDGRQDIRHLCTDELAACGLTTSDLVLKEEGDAEDPDFLHALVLHPDGSAQWRIGLEPLSDGDEA